MILQRHIALFDARSRQFLAGGSQRRLAIEHGA